MISLIVVGFLLGIKIAGSAIAFFGGILAGVYGFYRLSYAADAFGKRNWRLRLACWFCLFLGGPLFASGVVTYWLSICDACR